MNTLPNAMGTLPEGWTALLLSAAVNSFLLLAPVAAVLLVWRKGSGANRHLTWLAALGSLLLLPVAGRILLPVDRPAWAGEANLVTNWVINLTYTAPEKATAPPLTFTVPGQLNAGGELQTVAAQTRAAHSLAKPAPRIKYWIQITWGLGVLLTLAGIGYRLVMRARLARQAKPLADAACLEVAQAEEAALGLKRPVRLLLSTESVMPMTWGVVHPVILLPAEAVAWSATELRLVLRHELIHIRRWDCLTQGLARLVCALFWFNPLAWLAARQMRAERERACDDLVLRAGTRPSEYAGCLLEMARRFAHTPRVAALAMARSTNLERRLRAIVDPASQPARLRPLTALLVCAGFVAGTLFFFGPSAAALDTAGLPKLAAVRKFVETKHQQALALAKAEETELAPEMEDFFAAGKKGEWQEFTNGYYHMQKAKQRNRRLQNATWSTAMECLGYYELCSEMEPKYLKAFGDDTLAAIPSGSVYFGGTDPGRFVITAMSKSHADADPCFTVTQNALADGTYLQYVRQMYGKRLYIPTADDSQRCFQEYLDDAQKRLVNNQLKPGEDVRIIDNRVQVSGQVAVMAINGLLAKIIFDKNPDREFYVEESFPLDWMYPHLSPHGLILKVNRKPLAELSEAVVNADRQYWQKHCDEMIGPWLKADTSVKEVAAFAAKVFGEKNLDDFKGDARYVRNAEVCKMYGKLRSAIAGVYVWRVANSKNDQEKARLAEAADFAFRQAVALCPYSPEALFRYVNFLVTQKRTEEALVLTQAAQKLADQRQDDLARQLADLARQLKQPSQKDER